MEESTLSSKNFPPHGATDVSTQQEKLADGDLNSQKAHEPTVINVQDEKSYDHLPRNQRDILERETAMISVSVSYSMLFRYATKADIAIYVLGAICAIAGGAAQPFMTVIFGQFTGTFQKLFQGTLPDSNFNDELSRLSLDFVYLGIGQFLAVYISVVSCTYSGEHVTQKLRERYLAAVLRQNIAFFDNIGAGEITSTITNNMDLVQCGISEKVALAISPLASFVTALIIGFSRNWRLSCVLLSTVLAVILIMGLFSVFVVKYSTRSLDAYAIGGTLAEEAISSIRTVTAMEGQGKLSTKYNVALAKSMHWGFRMKTSVGCMVGAMMSIVTATYAIGFWEGSRLLVSGHSSVAHTITVLMALMISAVSLARAAPHLRAFGEAIAAAENIFKIIDRPSPSTVVGGGGAPSPNNIRGELEFRDVKHIYPSRPGTTVLENFNLIVPAGKVTALVGSSGSGKSTIVGLVERFYSPVHGQIFLDGLDIQTLDLKWLRRQISLVGQEPVLFNCSIRQNIEHGLIGTDFENSAEEKRLEVVIQAAKIANAHAFITSLPSGYKTLVGANGVLLSGGQKQRIAIARAVISDPKILLLDEATSALDSQSEGIVQAALNVASQGRTTIVIAHRLSTIKAADNIVVLSRGQMIEQGSHEELVQRRGSYFKLIETQRLGTQNVRGDLNHLNDDQTIDHGRMANEWEHAQEYIEKELRDLSPTSKGPRALDDGTRYSLWTTMKFIAAFNKKETRLMILGLFFSIVAGGAMPVQGVLFAKCISSLSLPSTRYSQLRSDIDFWSLMYFVVAVVMFLVSCGYGIVFAYCSELLISRARDLAFRSILRQDISFFDQDDNSAGSLTATLSSGASDIAGISGATLGAILNFITTIISATILSCIIGWKLGLVCTSTVPVLLLGGYSRMTVFAKFQARASKAYRASATLACEAVSSISTIASLTREEEVWSAYHDMLQKQLSQNLNSVLKTSWLFAGSDSFALFCMALGFWYGGRLILSGEYSMFQFFVCFSSVIFSAQSAGALFSFAPDMAKSRDSAQQLKLLCAREPEIDSWSDVGDCVPDVVGQIDFHDVYFSYPTRRVPVLQGLNLNIAPGEFVALVGASGCGKSTTIALLERFYNASSGIISIDGQDISKLKVRQYRSHIALVSQEPVLFSGTVRENIALGVADDMIDEENIVEVCKTANIWDFIESLPNGLSTHLGTKGVLLSGGQKQRIALARALIRKPKILLLDEAISALDSESERLVQHSIDSARKDRTTIAVAHRLSTIQGADRIFVIDEGKVVESGSHQELMRKGGVYREMAERQRLGL